MICNTDDWPEAEKRLTRAWFRPDVARFEIEGPSGAGRIVRASVMGARLKKDGTTWQATTFEDYWSFSEYPGWLVPVAEAALRLHSEGKEIDS